ncbi:aldehyde dehydrogenase family protein, partial [Methylophaga sp.]
MTTPHFPLKIAGLSKTEASRAEVFSPFNEQLLGTVDQANKADIDKALTTAHSLFKDRSQWLKVVERIAILEKAVEMMKAEADSLAVGAAEEG